MNRSPCTGLSSSAEGFIEPDCAYQAVSHGDVVPQESIAHLPMYSLVFVHKSNIFRRAALRVTLHPLFDWVMLAAIMGNCVTLAMWTNEPGWVRV